VSTLRRRQGWGVASHVVFWSVTVVELGLVLFFALYIASTEVPRFFGAITAIIIVVMLLFSVVSGIVVLVTIKNIPTSDPKLLFRTTVQLLVLSFVELLSVLALGAVSAVSTFSAVLTSFSLLYGIGVVLAQLSQWIVMAALILQSRMYFWQLKEGATARVNTREESAQRGCA
jgi:hypothetical protein